VKVYTIVAMKNANEGMKCFEKNSRELESESIKRKEKKTKENKR